MGITKIEWCDYTFNHIRGCTKVSAGCANCYAETLSKRNPGTLGIWGPNGTRVVAAESAWKEPLKWDKESARGVHAWKFHVELCKQLGIADPAAEWRRLARGEPIPERHRVFCASLADIFEDWAGPMVTVNDVQLWKRDGSWTTSDHYRDTVALTMDDVRARLFRLIDATPNLDWLILSKRPENFAKMMPPALPQVSPVRKNLWLGVSVEDQKRADERIPLLLKSPAAVRFLSCEPLLGPIDLLSMEQFEDGQHFYRNVLSGHDHHPEWESREPWSNPIDWVIIGGESGHGARLCNLKWILDIVRQCKAASVPVFVKQYGSRPVVDYYSQDDELRQWALDCRHTVHWPGGEIHLSQDGQPPPGSYILLKLADKKGGAMEEWFEETCVREFPNA